MAAIRRVCTIEYVAEMLGEDVEMLEAIVSNSDNLAYGTIISVCMAAKTTVTALTDNGIDELRDMLAAARRSTQEWDDFLENVVDDPDITARLQKNAPR